MSLPSSAELQDLIDRMAAARTRLHELAANGISPLTSHAMIKTQADMASARFSLYRLLGEVKEAEGKSTNSDD